MKKQTFNMKPLLLLSSMVLLFFGFYTPEAMAQVPRYLLKGQLPIPGSSETSGLLSTTLHGVLLENQGVQLVWEEDGNLTLRFYDEEILWSSNTSGTGATLFFMEGDGRLLIKDQNNNEIWSAGTSSGAKLWLQSNRNLVLQNSSNQTVWNTETAITPLGTDGVQRIQRTRHHEDFMIPYTDYQYITIRTEGADGGKKQVLESWGATRFQVKAGSGATIIGTYEIGTGDDQIPPGSFIRVFVGEKGGDRHDQGLSGCAGGGGTGIFVKRYDDPEWRLLQVAGGGGGAYSDCCLNKSEGRSAETGTDGGAGVGPNGGDGGTNGGDGDGYAMSPPAWPGYGVLDEYNFWDGGDDDPTILPGRTDYSMYVPDDAGDGRFGLGPSGDGGTAGGGGGGYSGGGGGATYGGGGGGGSYLNTGQVAVHNIVKVKNDRTTNTQDGYIEIEFGNVLPDQAIHFAYNTGKCVDVYGSSTSNGTNIQTWTCHGDNNQQWIFGPNDRTIRSKLNAAKCLSLKDDTGNNGTNIHLWDCKVNDNQRFVYNGLYKTIHSARNANKCIDAVNGSAYPNANVNVQLWDCKYANNNQKWEIEGATTVSNVSNMKHIVPVLAPNFAVHSHTGAESGSNIQLWTKDITNTAEQWYFDGLAIKMRDHQNLCIDLKSSSTSNGNNIQLYNCNDTNAQKWLYDGMTQSIRSVINQGKCLQIVKNTDGVYGKRSNVEIYDCNGSDVQQFLIE